MITEGKEKMELLSGGEPSDYTKKRISFRTLYTGTRDFLMENFRGAVSFDEDITSSENLVISPDGFAYFFKYVLNVVFGNTVLNVKMTSVRKDFTVTLDWKKHRSLTEGEELALQRIALASGFKLNLNETNERITLTLYAEAKIYGYINIYAPVFNNQIKTAFNRVFYLT